MNLDGETNLKEKFLLTSNISRHIEDRNYTCDRMTGAVDCDLPDENLNHYTAKVRIEGLDDTIDCDIRNLLLRGCTLRNIDYICGIVVYIGSESKIMLNSKKSPKKVSSMMKMSNIMLYSIFAF